MLDNLPLKTLFGEFTVNHHTFNGRECVSLSCGDVSEGTPLVRMHSSCVFSESFRSTDCDCADQLQGALKLIHSYGKGACIYLYDEGRGHGLSNKIKSMKCEHVHSIDTVEAFKRCGLDLDVRDYGPAIHALADLNVAGTVRLISNNFRKRDALSAAGYIVTELVELSYPKSEDVSSYLKVKRDKLGHLIRELP